MEGNKIMVQMKVRGFVSNVYFYVNLLLSAFLALLFAMLLVIEGRSFSLPNILFPCIVFCFVMLGEFLHAPKAYKRFSITSSGVRCGKEFIRFEEIEKIAICKGCVHEWFGFRFIENVFGILQHTEIYVEDMICINCDYRGFNAKNLIYIPRNSQTDQIMRTYCKNYNEISDIRNKETFGGCFSYGERFLGRIIAVCILCLLAVVAMVFAMIYGNVSVYKAIILASFGIAWMIMAVFKREIAALISKRISRKIQA